MTSCDDKHNNIGKLCGNWQLLQIDTLKNNNDCSMKDKKIFMAIQLKLVCFTNYSNMKNMPRQIFFRFHYTGDSLTLYSPYVNHRTEDTPLQAADTLRYYGIEDTTVHYAIEALDEDKLVLRSNNYKLYFRNY